MALLNIGLIRSAGSKVAPKAPLNVAVVIECLQSLYGRGIVANVAISDTEPTLVVQVPRDVTHLQIERLCKAFDQDAIAWLDDSSAGHMAGPKASLWGPFSPEYFLLPDGTRLGDRMVIAA